MRVAIIGAGGNFGSKRLKAIRRSHDSVVALCDLQFEQPPQMCNEPGARLVTDYRRLLDLDFDLAVVSLPDHVKLQVVADFLAAGKHVLVEKPLSLSVSEVHRLFSIARQNNVCLYVGYNIQFFPSVAMLLGLLRDGYLGPVHHVRMFYGHGGVHSLLGAGNWRIEKTSWGGAFVDMGTHLLSLASQFIRRVDSGALERQHIVSEVVEDNCTALLKGDGCLVELTSSWTAWRSRFCVEVYGSEGFAELDGLVKYVKYGQPGERIRYGCRNPSGPPSVTERMWTLSTSEQGGAEGVDPFSVELEYLDWEWRWLTTEITAGTYDMVKEEETNLLVADVCERFYR